MIHRRDRVQFVMEKHPLLEAANRIRVHSVGGESGPIVGGDEAEGLGLASKIYIKITIKIKRREGRDGWVLKHLLQREAQAFGLGFRKHGNAANGIPAQFKEIII